MKPSRKMPWAVLVAGVFLVANGIHAQKLPAYLTPGEEKRDEEGYTIYSGYVVAMGVLLPRPYIVAFREDTVWINNIALDPPRDNPIPPPYIPPSDTAMERIAVWYDLRDNYPIWRDSLGEQKAQEMVRKKYENNWVVKKIEFSEDGKNLWVTFIEGYRRDVLERPVTLKRVCDPRDPNVDYKAKRREEKQRRLQITRNNLQRGGIVLFGYSDSDMQFLQPEEAQRILELVRNIKNGSVSLEFFKSEMYQILTSVKMSQEILDNIHSWPNDNQ